MTKRVLTVDDEKNLAGWEELNGGSQPGALSSVEFLFTETAGAGVYTASLPISAGSVVVDIFVYPLVSPWDTDTALLDIADVLTGAGAYCNALPFAGVDAVMQYDPATSGPGAGVYCLQGMTASGQSPLPVYHLVSAFANGNGACGIRYAADDTITMTMTTTGTGGSSGRALVKVIIFTPQTPTVPAKT